MVTLAYSGMYLLSVSRPHVTFFVRARQIIRCRGMATAYGNHSSYNFNGVLLEILRKETSEKYLSNDLIDLHLNSHLQKCHVNFVLMEQKLVVVFED